ncbi:MAG: protoporphyrinogen oxidase HemJ [Brevundimonas sp.]|jgi:protoporphyrinogen IX oxidase|uniref:protoporphyrinogen oxidase HemJ n=1 Tax=Brevundimonas sp. TaxID=1871086 RepID=UPI00391AD8C4
MSAYDWLRGLHILAVIAWMAGLLYLPRLYAYHTRAERGSQMDQTFQVMEARLLRIIMTPAMVASWAFGLALIWVRTGGLEAPQMLMEGWMHAKLLGVVLLSGWHGYLAASQRRFAEGRNTRSEKFWRISNELPFLLAIVIVLSATVEWSF